MNHFEIIKFDQNIHLNLIESLTEMLHKAYRPLVEKGMRYLASHQSPEITLKRLTKGDSFFAFDDGKLVGTITMVKEDPTEPASWYQMPDVYFFMQFAVDPNYQSLGVGSKLLRFVEEHAKKEGAKELALDTSENAHELIAMYNKKGYRFIEYASWEVTNYKSVILSKKLL